MTKIEWTDESWNVVTGCTPVTRGCDNCYAKAMHKRLRAVGHPKYKYEWGTVKCHHDELDRPLRWRKPRMIMTPSMGDLFHADVPAMFASRAIAVMRRCPRHIFQVLTKRPKRMAAYFDYTCNHIADMPMPENLWLGVSVCEQADADMIRTLQTIKGAVVRFVSYEPAIGPIRWSRSLLKGIGWVICGCESGPGRRSFERQWARDARNACQAAGIPFFFKQATDASGKVVKMPYLDGKVWNQIPEIVDG